MDLNKANFAFAIDDPKISDSVLYIEMVDDSVGTNQTTPKVTADLAAENRKPGVVIDQEDGNEASMKNDASGNFSAVSYVRTIHISSAILAKKSPFFYKLFMGRSEDKPGGSEDKPGASEEQVAKLQIHASEESDLMELLKFMYNNTVSKNKPSELLDILKIADKFEVASCMQYCSEKLSKFPMTIDSALRYVDLQSSVSHTSEIQPLIDSAKKCIAVQFREINKYENKVLNLPLTGLEAVLSSDDIEVESEDVIYDLVLKWAELHYPNVEIRRELLRNRLSDLIRFPFLGIQKLKKIVAGTDFNSEIATALVSEALFFKINTPQRRRQLASGIHASPENSANAIRRFVERAYRYRPVKVIEFELPRPQCVVYLDLKREECMRLLPDGRIDSKVFHLGRRDFFLSAQCIRAHIDATHWFAFILAMQENGSAECTLNYEFAVWEKEEDMYKTKYRGSYRFVGGTAAGTINLFGVPWATFIAEDSAFFINDMLHLRAQVTVMQ